MALVMTPIYTQTVGAGGASGVTFNNIPQIYTDLKLFLSVRDSASAVQWGFNLFFNNNLGAIYSTTLLRGNGSSASSLRFSSQTTTLIFDVPGSQATANTFSNTEIYIPNYTSSNFKSVLADSVMENNNASSFMGLNACLAQTTSAITRLDVTAAGSWIQHSTVSLYGIIRSGA